MRKSQSKKLYLLRHAQAESVAPGVDDINKPLHSLGIIEANQIASSFSENSECPELIICSPAVRTYSTALIFGKRLGYQLDRIVLDKRIYEADFRTLIKVVSQVNTHISSILLVGHNPAISQLAGCLDSEIAPMSTASLIGFSFDAEDWMHFELAEQRRFLNYCP